MEVKASDLRIGNLISAATGENDEPIPCVVFKITKDWVEWNSVGRDDGGNKTSISGVKGIPLSCEVLEKCGFKDKVGNGMAYRMDINGTDEICHYLDEESVRYQTINSGFTRHLEHIKYVHQLQNWFYFMTNSELTVNL